MKRILCALLAFAMVFCFFGCKNPEQELMEPVSFYYPCVLNTDSLEANGTPFPVIDSELREAEGHRQDLLYLLSLYLRGPESGELAQIFPAGTGLVSVELTEGQLCVTLTEQFGQLTGLPLSMACACLTLTCLELCDADTVSIQAQGILLDGQNAVVMSRDSLILTDKNTYTSEPTE